MAKQTNKVIVSKFGRLPIINRPVTLNSDNTPRAIARNVQNPLSRQRN